MTVPRAVTRTRRSQLPTVDEARDAMNDKLKSEIGKWIVRTTLGRHERRRHPRRRVRAAQRGRTCRWCELRPAPICSIRRSISLGALWNRGRGVTEQIHHADRRRRRQSTIGCKVRSIGSVESGESDAAAAPRCDVPARRVLAARRLPRPGASPTTWRSLERVDESLRFGDFQGMYASWTTDARDGFSDAADRRARRNHADAHACIDAAHDVSDRAHDDHRPTSVTTPRCVCSPATSSRGRADPIRAVVWFSDLVGFTRISDKVGADGMLALLNDYAEAQVEAIEAHGGHVLKFIGDGILAIFPDDQAEAACAQRARCRRRAASPHRRAQRAAHRGRTAGDRYAYRAARRRAPLRQRRQPAAPRLHRRSVPRSTRRRGSRRCAGRWSRRSSCRRRSPKRRAMRGAVS